MTTLISEKTEAQQKQELLDILSEDISRTAINELRYAHISKLKHIEDELKDKSRWVRTLSEYGQIYYVDFEKEHEAIGNNDDGKLNITWTNNSYYTTYSTSSRNYTIFHKRLFKGTIESPKQFVNELLEYRYVDYLKAPTLEVPDIILGKNSPRYFKNSTDITSVVVSNMPYNPETETGLVWSNLDESYRKEDRRYTLDGTVLTLHIGTDYYDKRNLVMTNQSGTKATVAKLLKNNWIESLNREQFSKLYTFWEQCYTRGLTKEKS